MKKHFFHKAVHIFLLVVMTMTSTGFTTVVGFCAMSKSTVCCCDNDNSCTNVASSKTPSIKGINPSCYSEKIIGGVNNVKAIVSSELSQKTLLLAIETEVPECNTVEIVAQTLAIPHPPHSVVSHSCVDIYIQVSSFLI
ncbi:MAG: hypothetical protein M0R68_05055 [Bacteroidetes bacterium]|nr:hypothetical protein [Bacteroidota bacterium]